MDDLETIRKAALRFLNFKPRSEHELRQRLARKKLSTESVDHVVMWLQKGGMLDDEKFAKLYALSRVQSRGLGKAQIRRELTRRGISPARVSQAMRSIEDFDEFEVAKNLAARRLPSLKGLTADVKRRRLHGMLVRRGFQAQTIFKVLNALSISQSEAWDANE